MLNRAIIVHEHIFSFLLIYLRCTPVLGIYVKKVRSLEECTVHREKINQLHVSSEEKLLFLPFLSTLPLSGLQK